MFALAGPVMGVAAELYRYKDHSGNTVIDDHVPPEFVKNGYEVVNSKGVVLRVVPRQLSEEEQKAADALKEQELEAQREEARMREWDESLLRRYSTVADIEAARERALNDLRIRVSILKSNRRGLKQQVENYQSEAAELERRGRKVGADHLSAISDLQSEIATTERSIGEREEEIADVEAAFAADIARFEEIQDMVEFRRQALDERAGRSRDKAVEDPRR
ncbi:hypothetical protein E4634_14625 [Mangrovimicrobium sediminis]|uniref:DUF4124 domain-containing protein n=1 Tax=Mangrovimicrobium sediminis TaxID=2562682 RepID=A0A4Z0LZQ5_9GAMM|nr:DUF4124 domain-containing protein [Haliea sp. SAOS-164]TGD72749.1 hypothetical protein E4634_14625 [Haliea sp. SAOS-164]